MTTTYPIDFLGRVVVDGETVIPHAPTEPPAWERKGHHAIRTREAGCRECGTTFPVSVHVGPPPERCPECRRARKNEQAARYARERRQRQREGRRAS